MLGTGTGSGCGLPGEHYTHSGLRGGTTNGCVTLGRNSMIGYEELEAMPLQPHLLQLSSPQSRGYGRCN